MTKALGMLLMFGALFAAAWSVSQTYGTFLWAALSLAFIGLFAAGAIMATARSK